MTRAFFCNIAFIFVLYAPYYAIASGIPYEEIEKAANDEIKLHLNGARIEDLRFLGFENQTEIDHAELGEGYQIFTIPPDKLLDESKSQDYLSMVTPTGEWEFPVLAGGKGKVLLKVAFRDGKWKNIRMGGSGFASLMVIFQTFFPASSGYHYRFISEYPFGRSFIELSQGFKLLGIIPINSIALNEQEITKENFLCHLRDPKDVLPGLRAAVKQRIEGCRKAPKDNNKWLNIYPIVREYPPLLDYKLRTSE